MTTLPTTQSAPTPEGARRPAIEVRAVSKTYPGTPPVTALHPSCLRLDLGDHLSPVGASGSGNSTLLPILGTLDSPTDGTVLVDDRGLGDMREVERSATRAARISFVFQQFHLLPTVSA